MNKIKILILLSVLGLSLAACDEDYDINKLHDNAQLLVYCFPTESDTTVIAVYSTVPITSKVPNPDTLANKIVDAHIIYKVNGQEMPIERITFDNMLYLSTDTLNPAKGLQGQYYAIGHQQAGDKIEVIVEAKGFPTVSASTYIPEKVDVRIDTVMEERDATYSYNTLQRTLATFADNGTEADYYMVRAKRHFLKGCITGKAYEHGMLVGVWTTYSYYDYTWKKDKFDEWDFSDLKWTTQREAIDPNCDPVFENLTKIDEDFGVDEYVYMDNAYFFNDQLFNGSQYTLHLDIANLSYSGEWDAFAPGSIILDLYKLTPEYYRFIKSMTDRLNDSWLNSGLMQMSPTYSNVRGGFGIVAGYAVSTTSHTIPQTHKNDNTGERT